VAGPQNSRVGAARGCAIRGCGNNNIGTLTVTNCTFSGNTAGYGGGAIENEGTLTLTNSTVSANSVSGLGGGINNDDVVTVTDCTFTGNSAATYGGGIYNFAGIVTVTNSTLSGNFANASNGGGIENATYGTLTVTNSTLTGNSAGTLGGGICNDLRATATVTSCTLSGNSARSGGGISNTYLLGTVTLGNTIVAGNTAGDISGSGTFSQTYSLVGGQPRLAPLGDYGGPTQTMPLLAGSPALNAGDPSQLGTTDQRGLIRTGGVNIGAYQASASAFVLSAPATALPGEQFDLTVMAVDIFGQNAVGYTGTVTFSTTDPDPGVVLPAGYTFSLADAGSVTFAAGVTLITPGGQTITATDTVDNTITGSTTVTVGGTAPGPGSHGQEQPRQPSRLQGNVPPASESSHHEVAAGDRWFVFLNQTDSRFVFSQPFHSDRAGMDRWTLDPWWATSRSP
jgi:predicted outer membrane repeat protein